MSHVAVVSVLFNYPRHTVYEALCDLGHYPSWNTGMTHISYTGRMHPGLRYEANSEVLGIVNHSQVHVEQMVPDESITLVSHTGIIKFRATFKLEEESPETCSVICRVHFDKSIFNLAHSIIEAATESRIRHDLETLRTSLQS